MPIHGYPGNVITANPTAPTSSVASGVWTTEQQLLAVSQGNWPGYEYPIFRSLRFNSADTAYLNRTPATATNRRTWTWSAWVKRSTLGTTQELFDGYWANTDNGYFWVGFTSADAFEVQLYNSTLRTTTQVFRDPSAWYHFVLAVDTTQATAANRVKVYLNGSEITTFSTNNAPTQNLDTAVNYNGAHYIGTFSGTTNLFNGYQTEINLIDGQALDPSSFGLNDPETGVWSPKRYTGTYGTNGFYLKFADNSGTTSTTLGKDSSGNGNNWTPNNFSVTAGAGNDSLVDSPTAYGTDTGVGGEVRGNYCTLNPLDKTAAVTLSNGNLQALLNGINYFAKSTIAISSGKWYWEVTASATAEDMIGITKADVVTTGYFGSQATSYGYYKTNGNKYNSATGTAYGASYASGDIIGVALDLDAGTLTYYKNGVSQGTAFTGLSGTFFAGVSTAGTGGTQTINFGQRPFEKWNGSAYVANTAPSGFKALCTQNLPTPTIGATSTTQANDYFNAVLYSGNSSTQAITGVGFQPDFVWCKARSTAAHHIVTDAVRTAAKVLSTSQTAAESAWADNAFFQSLNSDGFTLTGGGTGINTTGNTYVAWNWKANGAGSSNTAGTITSTVSANTTSGFSIVTYTGTGSNATVGHGLGAVPGMIIAKRRSATQNWGVAHSALTGTQTLYLDLTQAVATGVWNGTPTSTVFNITTDGVVNASGSTYVAYCFAPVAGYSAFGSYTGNGSTDGPFVYTGFRPRYIVIKMSSGVEDWRVFDTARSTYNIQGATLYPNTSSAENSSQLLDINSNGFKCRTSDIAVNGSGSTYIYFSFAENPFKYSLAR